LYNFFLNREGKKDKESTFVTEKSLDSLPKKVHKLSATQKTEQGYEFLPNKKTEKESKSQ